MADHRHGERDGALYELKQRRVPRQIVVGAHRPTHHRYAGKRPWVCRHAFTTIDRDQPERHGVRIEPFGEVSGSFGGRETKNGNGLQGDWMSATRQRVAARSFGGQGNCTASDALSFGVASAT